MNIMVTLVNVKKSNNLIVADYFLESNNYDKGHLEYDVEKKQVIKYSYSKEDADSTIKYGLSKATKAIEKLIEFNKFPETYRYIWY